MGYFEEWRDKFKAELLMIQQTPMCFLLALAVIIGFLFYVVVVPSNRFYYQGTLNNLIAENKSLSDNNQVLEKNIATSEKELSNSQLKLKQIQSAIDRGIATTHFYQQSAISTALSVGAIPCRPDDSLCASDVDFSGNGTGISLSHGDKATVTHGNFSGDKIGFEIRNLPTPNQQVPPPSVSMRGSYGSTAENIVDIGSKGATVDADGSAYTHIKNVKKINTEPCPLVNTSVQKKRIKNN